MEYSQDDYLMISGIQHFKFCRRQWALIHVEQQWAENEHTVIGELMHKKAHDPYLTEKRKDILVVRALPVSSRSMGVSGECDIVEFHKCEDGVKLYGHRGTYSLYPIEYKKGKPKESNEDELRDEVKKIFGEMHDYYDRNYTPKVKTSKRCVSCSLKDICMPKIDKSGSVKSYINKMLGETL